MSSNKELMKENRDEDEIIKDEQARRDIHIFSARLYDIRERFMKIIQNINNDTNGFVDEISDEDDTTEDEESSENFTQKLDEKDLSMILDNEMSIDDEDDNSTRTSSDDDDDEKEKKKSLIKSILEYKSRRYEYIKHVMQYPKIIRYLINDDSNCTSSSS